MVDLAQYNSSTGKAGYDSSTGKALIAAPGVPCAYCPTGETPYQVEVIYSGWGNRCTDCLLGTLRYELSGDFAAVINDTHILTQTVDPCLWKKTGTLPTSMHRIDYEFGTIAACEAGTCGDISGVDSDEFFTYNIELRKISSTDVRLDISMVAGGKGVLCEVKNTTAGVAGCFDINGTWVYASAFSESLAILSIGTLVINE